MQRGDNHDGKACPHIMEKQGTFKGDTDTITGNSRIMAKEKAICIYASIRYYQLDRVVQQEPVHVERKDLYVYR